MGDVLIDLVDAMKAGNLLPWAVEHAPAGDADGVIARAWAETRHWGSMSALARMVYGDHGAFVVGHSAASRAFAAERRKSGLPPSEWWPRWSEVCRSNNADHPWIRRPAAAGARAIRRRIPAPPTLAQLLAQKGPPP